MGHSRGGSDEAFGAGLKHAFVEGVKLGRSSSAAVECTLDLIEVEDGAGPGKCDAHGLIGAEPAS
jgi:hypothetical protein